MSCNQQKLINIAHSFQILGHRDWNHLPLNHKGQIWLLNFQSKTPTFGKFCPKFSPFLAWQSSSRLTLGRLRSLEGVAFREFPRKILDFFPGSGGKERNHIYILIYLLSYVSIYLLMSHVFIHFFLCRSQELEVMLPYHGFRIQILHGKFAGDSHPLQ